MKPMLLFCAAVVWTSPAAVAAPAQQIADSKQAHSTVSVAVEPQLNDGRLVIKIAAQNGTTAPVPFGPGSVSVSKVAGQPIALSSLRQLVNDVRVAAGAPADSPVAGSYAARPQPVAQDGSGRMDVTGYSAGSSVGGNEYVRRNRPRAGKPTISKAEAEAQIAALNQAILHDQTIAPGQIAVGQLVSEKLKFGKDEDRTLHLVVQVAGDNHAFTIAAPSD